MTRLEERQKSDSATLKAEQDRKDKIFSTDEQIRAWRATTGTKAGSSDNFSDTQTNKGASEAGVTINDFVRLDPDLKNFFINTPQGTDPDDESKKMSQIEIFDKLFEKINNKQLTHQEVVDLITGSTKLPQAVKQYFIEKIPLDPIVKETALSKIWGFVKEKAGGIIGL